ncbi:MAG: VanW family protein [Oscillospiraceae bacterium]|nr:VanW family protein [Oscillospiraceae bacterium]
MGNIRLVSSRGRKQGGQRIQKEPRGQQVQTTAAPRKAPKARRRKSGKKVVLTVVLVLAFGIAAAAIALGIHLRSLDTILPNVWAEGVELSGLTFEEAVDALIAAGYENNADGVAVTVSFPNGESFTITGYEVGFALDAREAAQAAFEVGRAGEGALENEVSFLRAHFERTDLRELSRARFNEDFVRDVVSEYTNAFNLALIDDAYTITDESITIEIGTGIQPADLQSVLELTIETLFRALDEQTHLTVSYIPQESESYDVDLRMLFEAIHSYPVEAVYDPATFSATESSVGVSFDLVAAERMLQNASLGDTIEIPLIVTEPEMTTEYLDSMLFRDVISERTTRIAGTAARLNNVTLSGYYINETILNPGEEFSFNRVVGQRTAARGFRDAGGFSGGRLVDMMGGGICQTSSTLYYAALIANLRITERQEHGLTVGYIPLGHDATVFWGQIDLRFVNNRDFPIRLEVYTHGDDMRSITARIVGTLVDEYTFTTSYVVLERNPFPTIRQEDPDVPPGQTVVDLPGSTGFLVETFVSRLDGEGNVVERWSIGRSRYRVQNRVILVPPATEEEEADEPAASDVGETPPDEQPPAEQPPAEQPPAEQPPEQPPVYPPAEDQPEEGQAPAEQPPTEQPSENQPAYDPPPQDDVFIEPAAQEQQPPAEQPAPEQPTAEPSEDQSDD